MSHSIENAGCEKACLHCDNNTVTNVSKAFLEITGYTEKELLYKSLPEVSQILFGLDLSLFNMGDGVICCLITKGGTLEDISLRMVETPPFGCEIQIFKEDGSSAGEAGNNIIKSQLSMIINTNRNLETVFENMTDALFISDRNGRLLKLNAAARGFFQNYGCATDFYDMYLKAEYLDMEGRPIPFHNMPASRLLRGEPVSHMRMVIRNRETEIFTDISGILVRNGKSENELAILCSRDVTAKVQYERLASMQLDHIYKIIDILDLPIIRLTYPDFKVIRVNRKAGFIAESLVGRPIESDEFYKYDEKDLVGLVANPGAITECFEKMEQTRNTVHLSRLELRSASAVSFYNLILQPFLDADSNIKEVLVIAIDISHEVKKTEDIKNELQMKDEYLSFISHEFKTPLAVITSAIQAIETICKNDLTDKLKGFLGKIRQNSFRQLRLVNNLLDLTRADAGKIKLHMKNMDIVFLTRSLIESVTLYAQQKGVKLHFKPLVPQKRIGIDDEKYERILLNLLSNAIKFTPNGKSVIVGVYEEGDKVAVRVRDEGIGIPKERQDIIFNRFGQVDSMLSREAEGSGLGLSLVKMFVSALGGEIRLESEPGAGSTFTVLLPADEIIEADLEKIPENLFDNRLIQSIAIEFSDIYI